MSVRYERANSELQRCISEIIHTKMSDPRIGPLLFVSDVSVTPDFQFCKIKIAVDYESQKKIDEILRVLERSEGYIKRELAQMVRMPHMPKLQFVIDKGTVAAIRVNEILNTLHVSFEDIDKEGDDE